MFWRISTKKQVNHFVRDRGNEKSATSNSLVVLQFQGIHVFDIRLNLDKFFFIQRNQAPFR